MTQRFHILIRFLFVVCKVFRSSRFLESRKGKQNTNLLQHVERRFLRAVSICEIRHGRPERERILGLALGVGDGAGARRDPPPI
jgi:hypothetical protein